MVQTVKNLPAKEDTWAWSLGWEEPLEKRMATHSSTLAWRIPWTEEPGRQATVHGFAKSWTWLSNFHFTSLPSLWQFVTASIGNEYTSHTWEWGWLWGWKCKSGERNPIYMEKEECRDGEGSWGQRGSFPLQVNYANWWGLSSPSSIF